MDDSSKALTMTTVSEIAINMARGVAITHLTCVMSLGIMHSLAL